MANDSVFDTRYARFVYERRRAGDDAQTIRSQALPLLIESVESGELSILDSPNSPVSRAIMRHHSAIKFEMNSNWVLSPQDWCCPCCKRSKLQISRVGQHGQILAKSVVHHDHMDRALRTAFNAQFVAAGTDIEQVDGLELIRRISSAFSAYDEILVCEDCNNADTNAKRLFQLPDVFSFSIGQIATFISVADHLPHRLDQQKIEIAWGAAEPAYGLRMRIVDAVAHAAATDRHWYEPNGKVQERLPMLGSNGLLDPFVLKLFTTDEISDALGAKTAVSTPNMSKWRTEPKRKSKALPKNYLALLLSDQFSAMHWNKVEADWICPICRRKKEELVYVEDKGNVALHLHQVRTKNEAWQNISWICNHCSSVLMSLKWELQTHVGKIAGSYDFVEPHELRKIIIARPHSRHAVDAQLAHTLVTSILNDGRARTA
ncbi:hypothetical protein [Massilia sp. TS11]|uniref:hypothetical protein n=1 Tax=Massilia sp. TS11 TaxID=2908003 RepID=UPI001EDA281C|nr:hypothetical protein [Massilia sp. TS11]MCG2583906.1 hypothetical protein [Massilia sp. TS11]